MDIQSLRSLLPAVKIAGKMAYQEQSRKKVERFVKEDGSFVTAVDKNTETFLVDRIREQFPLANILSEETVFEQKAERDYTFILDPIDGTDVYSQGMAGWSVSIGLLDHNYLPIAGIVYSPALKLLFFADIGKGGTINGKKIPLCEQAEPITNHTNLMVPASIHKQMDLSLFPGKIRSIGSAALHLCFPLIYRGVYAAIETRGTHIWDIAGAHAISRSVGIDLEYFDGTKIEYAALLDGKTVGDTILAGTQERIVALKKFLRRAG